MSGLFFLLLSYGGARAAHATPAHWFSECGPAPKPARPLVRARQSSILETELSQLCCIAAATGGVPDDAHCPTGSLALCSRPTLFYNIFHHSAFLVKIRSSYVDDPEASKPDNGFPCSNIYYDAASRG